MHGGGDIKATTGRATRNLPSQQEHGRGHAKQEVTAHAKEGKLESKINPIMKVLEH